MIQVKEATVVATVAASDRQLFEKLENHFEMRLCS
jgi:hypothetical protein